MIEIVIKLLSVLLLGVAIGHMHACEVARTWGAIARIKELESRENS